MAHRDDPPDLPLVERGEWVLAPDGARILGWLEVEERCADCGAPQVYAVLFDARPVHALQLLARGGVRRRPLRLLPPPPRAPARRARALTAASWNPPPRGRRARARRD
jgi:hypothetical protein